MILQLLAALLPVHVPDETLAIVGADVVPMVTDDVLRDHTVLVREGRIVALAPRAEVDVPDGALVVEADGKWVMPGLVDMHVHSWLPAEHLLFVANGVTSVRNMFGAPLHLTWRDEIASGERLGPTIVTAGPIIDGDPPIWPGSRVVRNAEEGRTAVREQHEAGYDFVKVYNRVPLEAYDAIVAQAGELGMPVMGHVPDAVGLDRVLAAGQRTIEHLLGYGPHLCGADPSGDYLVDMQSWEKLEEERMSALVAATREADVWNCPTLIVLRKWVDAEEFERELERPFMRYVPPFLIQQWRGMPRGGALAGAARVGHEARARFTAALHEGGARLVLGTDQGNPLVAAGFAVHEELGYLVDAGLSPYEALRCATRNAAECLEAEGEFGTVAVGLRADLLVLEADPLDDVANAGRRTGVVVRGRWLPEAELQRMLEESVDQAQR